jgi:succinate-acetate transporter protein
VDRWRIRRKIIIGVVFFGLAMIVAGSIGLFANRYTDSMIFGGVTLVSGVVAFYQAMATLDDKWQGEMVPPGKDEVNPDG